MGSKVSRLPSRFPVGTRFVIEGRRGRIHQKYLEFPDGRQVQLPADASLNTPARPVPPMRRRPRQKVAAGKF